MNDRLEHDAYSYRFSFPMREVKAFPPSPSEHVLPQRLHPITLSVLGNAARRKNLFILRQNLPGFHRASNQPLHPQAGSFDDAPGDQPGGYPESGM